MKTVPRWIYGDDFFNGHFCGRHLDVCTFVSGNLLTPRQYRFDLQFRLNRSSFTFTVWRHPVRCGCMQKNRNPPIPKWNFDRWPEFIKVLLPETSNILMMSPSAPTSLSTTVAPSYCPAPPSKVSRNSIIDNLSLVTACWGEGLVGWGEGLVAWNYFVFCCSEFHLVFEIHFDITNVITIIPD